MKDVVIVMSIVSIVSKFVSWIELVCVEVRDRTGGSVVSVLTITTTCVGRHGNQRFRNQGNY